MSNQSNWEPKSGLVITNPIINLISLFIFRNLQLNQCVNSNYKSSGIKKQTDLLGHRKWIDQSCRHFSKWFPRQNFRGQSQTGCGDLRRFDGFDIQSSKNYLRGWLSDSTLRFWSFNSKRNPSKKMVSQIKIYFFYLKNIFFVPCPLGCFKAIMWTGIQRHSKTFIVGFRIYRLERYRIPSKQLHLTQIQWPN